MTASLDLRPPRVVLRRDAGNWSLQGALDRRGLGPVAGVDEAGRGACAGPLVVASCVLRPGDAARFEGLTDSKLLTAAARERMYDMVVKRAVDYAVVVIPVVEVDLRGVGVANIEGMRRAVARLTTHPGYVLVDGFRVPGLTAPSIPIVKGDQAAACVSAASILAKVTRDRIMVELHEKHPGYGFDEHKGYCTAEHGEALTAHGPCDDHRWSFVNVWLAGLRHGRRAPHRVAPHCYQPMSGDPTPTVDAEPAGVVQNEGSLMSAGWPDVEERVTLMSELASESLIQGARERLHRACEGKS